MILQEDIGKILEDYNQMKLRIGMTASHSALDICDEQSKKDSRRWHIAKKAERSCIPNTFAHIVRRLEE